MDSSNSRQSKLLGRLLGRFRSEPRYPLLDKRCSAISNTISEGTGVDAMNWDEEEEVHPEDVTTSMHEEDQFAANSDYRYSGQYLSPEQLPAFCDQLHNLVEVIRNIQTYAAVTGEYPCDLERRLAQEAREVSALAAEARNARDVVVRTRAQRRALRAQRKQLMAQIDSLRDAEIRDLENTVRSSDRKLYKSWENIKDSTDATMFEPLLEEVRNKQAALECLVKLIESKQAALTRKASRPTALFDNREDLSLNRRRQENATGPRRGAKRRRTNRDSRSVPLSNEPSQHRTENAPEGTSRYRVDSDGAVILTTVELPSRGSVRDILFFSLD